jgi:hypothetical protein
MAALLREFELFRSLDSRARFFRKGSRAVWVDQAGISEEEITFDIDAVLNKRLQKEAEPGHKGGGRWAERSTE